MFKLSIIGPTASGKSDLAIKIAKKIDAYILSIDSLSIYKEVNIVSAKPSKNELNEIKHFGIDELYLNEYFSVEVFIKLYKNVLKKAQNDGKNLIIVGGTSFYLKSLLDGLSPLPNIDDEVKKSVASMLLNPQKSFELLYDIDKTYMRSIAKNDHYRLEKALLIYKASGMPPSEYFKTNPPKPIIESLPIYNIAVDREILRERITKRGAKMYEMGLIDEICSLERKYKREPHAMGSIGIVEVLEYLDNKVSKDEMLQNIITHTAQLAKRQQTFNNTQFSGVTSAKLEDLEQIILSDFIQLR